MRLRIISGLFKGRLISVPQTEHTRPTTDRVKESMFNYLNNIIDFDDANVLDIYSGSGSLGFEALSRGAAHVTFIEKNYVPLKVLKENITTLKVESQATIVKHTAVGFTRVAPPRQFDLILADPPFFHYDIYEVVEGIKENNFLSPNGVMLIERSIQTLDKDLEGLGLEPYRRIGDACLYCISNSSNLAEETEEE